MKSIAFPFRGRNVWANLGCVALCMFIPVVGGMVAMGYLIVVEKRLIENLEADAPRFNFGRFSDYLTRGLWPFLVTLVLTLILMPIFMVIMVAIFLAVFLLRDHAGWMIAVIAASGLVDLAVILLAAPLFLPLVFKAGLQGKFVFDRGFALDFFKRVGLLTVGMYVLVSLLILPAALLSFCIPYVGLFALITIQEFVRTHINTQIYLIYLQRGGMPIPFEPEPAEPAFPVVVATPPVRP